MNRTYENTGFMSVAFGIVLMALGSVSLAGHCDDASSQNTAPDDIDWHAIMFLDQ